MDEGAKAGVGDALARRNAIVLALAQALAGANATVIFATGAITGSRIAPDPAWATLPITVFVVGMACGTLPTGWIVRHHGRRPAFIVGALAGIVSGLLGCVAVLLNSFPLFCFATFCGGAYAAVAQSYRFAAADTASLSFRPRAISWVMAGGVFAGVLGPQLVSLTMDLWAPALFAASYLAQASVACLALVVLAQVRIPRPSVASTDGGRPLSEIARQPAFLSAVVCGVVSYALMNLVMTAAPLAMHLCGHDVHDSNLAIQWHVLAMYGPSFFTGGLIARFGAPAIVSIGLALLAASAAVDMAGITVWHFWIGLILLGLGWNFGYIGASALVTQCCSPAERHKVQAFNDFLIFGIMAVGSLSSGALLATQGWTAVNLVVFPPLVLAALMLAWQAFGRRRARMA